MDRPHPGRRLIIDPADQAVARAQPAPNTATPRPGNQPNLALTKEERTRRNEHKNTPRGTTPTQAGAANDALLRARPVKGDPLVGSPGPTLDRAML